MAPGRVSVSYCGCLLVVAFALFAQTRGLPYLRVVGSYWIGVTTWSVTTLEDCACLCDSKVQCWGFSLASDYKCCVWFDAFGRCNTSTSNSSAPTFSLLYNGSDFVYIKLNAPNPTCSGSIPEILANEPWTEYMCDDSPCGTSSNIRWRTQAYTDNPDFSIFKPDMQSDGLCTSCS